MKSGSNSKRIKVLHLIKSLGRGGAEKLIPETALVHDQSRFEFHCLYFYHQGQNIIDELERAGIQVHLIPAGNLELFFQIKKVKHFILEHGFDIIHVHLLSFSQQPARQPTVFCRLSEWQGRLRSPQPIR